MNPNPKSNQNPSPAREASLLAERALDHLSRWLDLFDLKLQRAETEGDLIELRDFVHFLASLKRSLEVLHAAQNLAPTDTAHAPARIDPETLRRIFQEED